MLEARRLPLLPGVRRLAQQRHVTGGGKRNREYLNDKTSVDRSVRDDLVEVALDPQTSGGLLIALPADQADGLVERLRSSGIEAATRVGYATAAQEVSIRLT